MQVRCNLATTFKDNVAPFARKISLVVSSIKQLTEVNGIPSREVLEKDL